MMDIKFIRENKDLMKKVIKDKGLDLDLDKLLFLDQKRRKLIKETEEMKSEQNKLTKKGDVEEAKKIKSKIKEVLPELKKTEDEYKELMLLVPNIYSSDTPIGKDEKENKTVYEWGEIPKFDFKIKDHLHLGKELDLIDTEKGVKTSGFRGYYLKNEAAFMAMALIWYTILKMREKGFSLMITPTILREFALVGSGHFPFGKEEVYQIAKTPHYLAGTSEPSILAYFSDTILEEEDLPVKVCAFSQCYRSEAGSYGKDTKGLYRLHEFMKVEQVVLCRNNKEESDSWLEKMKSFSEVILQDLNLTYRVLQICTGDMGP